MTIISQKSLAFIDLQTIMNYGKSILCDDSVVDSSNLILSSQGFEPDTFTITDRLGGNCKYLSDGDLQGSKWLEDVFSNEIDKLISERIVYLNFEKDELLAHCLREFQTFLILIQKDSSLPSTIYNQEFPDIVRKFISYVLFHDPNVQLDTHKSFNRLAWELIPSFIESNINNIKDLKMLLSYSIASGLIGLDLKGGAAAASNFSAIQIPLQPVLNKETSLIHRYLLEKIKYIANNGLLIDHWDPFYNDVVLHPCNLVWILDDCIESFFDLSLIQGLLLLNSQLTISIIPKKGKNGNDMSYDDVVQALCLPIYKDLKNAFDRRQLFVSSYGPNMGTVNIRKLSSEVVSLINNSDCVFVKGCRAHEMIQGGINKRSYTAYVLARDFSESETGFNAKNSSLLFFKNEIGEYSYWGFKGRAKRQKQLPDGRIIKICYSTLEEHERRKQVSEPKEVLVELKRLLDFQEAIKADGYSSGLLQEISPLVENLVQSTQNNYNFSASEYRNLRKDEPHEMDKGFFSHLLSLAHQRMSNEELGENGIFQLLDIGTGPGRDLRYFTRFPEVSAIGIDNCDEFISILKKLAANHEIPQDTFFKMDMRDLHKFNDSSFDIVRHNATLLHLPMIMPGAGADLAVQESYRVLREHGLLFILVKKGEGMGIVDTREGLGGRFFQFYDEESLTALIVRNNFRLVDLQKAVENRPSGPVTWLAAYCEK